jgi:type I restriction enzyme R subunit
MDFGKTFFSKHSLLAILTRYCVFTTDKLLLVMRPYQIVATERILNRIVCSTNSKQEGKREAGGFIWHTTGSGKTLTSFKTSILASKLKDIDKVLFVVDRKDLDYQTMREYDKFKKGAANSNTSTAILKSQLEDPNARIIITTIQKLDNFISNNSKHKVFGSHIVIIFDECHRSQFGTMHQNIRNNFKKYHLFGFTGTPIFSDKESADTTEAVFGGCLHSYTIVNAINDGNVLPFRVDYLKLTPKQKNDTKEGSVVDIQRVETHPERIKEVVEYVIEHFDQKTYRDGDKTFEHRVVSNIDEVLSGRSRRAAEKMIAKAIKGFNSIFASNSIDMAKRYYAEFKKQMEQVPIDKQLKIALIYSSGANGRSPDGILADESFDTSKLDEDSFAFLGKAIKDYNQLFGTNYDISSSDRFENYYKDISLRLKNRELDMLIVCSMFLTGFDATTLNTLWVDKDLRLHGLLQAFSRTNRILNSVKRCGNIVCFCDLEQATKDAITRFGSSDALAIALLKTYKEYYEGYDEPDELENIVHYKGYKELVDELKSKFPLKKSIVGGKAERDFIKLYGSILKMKNILRAFDDFKGNEILSVGEYQDYQSVYIDLYDKLHPTNGDKKDEGGKSTEGGEGAIDDIVFEMELIKQTDINIDYILYLLEQNKLEEFKKAVKSSLNMRSKKPILDGFLKTFKPQSGKNIKDLWGDFVKDSKKKDLDKIITDEGLKVKDAQTFMENAFRDGEIKSTGMAFVNILHPLSMFDENKAMDNKKNAVFKKLKAFFDLYFDI